MKYLFLALLITGIGCGKTNSNAPAVTPPNSAGTAVVSPADQDASNVTNSDVNRATDSAQATTDQWENRTAPTPAPDTAVNPTLASYEQQIGYQKAIIMQEKAALNSAIAARNNQVNLGKDFIDLLAYGVSSGALTYDFLKGTKNVERVRSYFRAKDIPALVPPVTTTAEKWRMAGTAAFRTTEIVSAAVLGIFFVGDIYKAGSDMIIRFTDTKEIHDSRLKLEEAEKNLDVADQNLKLAIQSQK